jgi:hypothetical protein
LPAGGLGKSDHHPGFAWGDLDQHLITNGVGDGFCPRMYGGAEPGQVASSSRISALPVGIPIPDALFANTVPVAGGRGPPECDARALRQLRDGRAFTTWRTGCSPSGISTENVALLNSALRLLASSKTLRAARGRAAGRHRDPPVIGAHKVAFGNGTSLITADRSSTRRRSTSPTLLLSTATSAS